MTLEPGPTITAITLRMPETEHETLRLAAKVDGISVNQFVRIAVMDKIDARRSNPNFQSRLHAVMDEDAEILRRLSKD